MSDRWKAGFIQYFFDPLDPGPPTLPGDLYTWGANDVGQLGSNTTTPRSSPVQVASGKTWNIVSPFVKGTIGITGGGSLWGWGSNNVGQLGLGDTVYRSSPTQIGALTTWMTLATGAYHTAAIKSDGTLWTWGWNIYGQLGQNNTSHKSSPTQVGALTTWLKVAAGAYNTFAIKTDGTLWAWGANESGTDTQGALGLNEVGNKSSPIQVGALTNWYQVFSNQRGSVAIKTNGELWAIGGNNDLGILGQNDNISRSSPVQIGALTNWASLPVSSATRNISVAAIKTDKTLWVWGYNNDGMLGINQSFANPYTSVSSPTQVGTLANWQQISIGRYTMGALKTDGTLWAWGIGNNGRLGLNSTATFSSPVQVGSQTYWGFVMAGEDSGAAITKI